MGSIFILTFTLKWTWIKYHRKLQKILKSRNGVGEGLCGLQKKDQGVTQKNIYGPLRAKNYTTPNADKKTLQS